MLWSPSVVYSVPSKTWVCWTVQCTLQDFQDQPGKLLLHVLLYRASRISGRFPYNSGAGEIQDLMAPLRLFKPKMRTIVLVLRRASRSVSQSVSQSVSWSVGRGGRRFVRKTDRQLAYRQKNRQSRCVSHLDGR